MTEQSKVRPCKKCGEIKETARDCKPCATESGRKWRAANPEKQAEMRRKWNAANPEKVAETARRAKLRKFGITTEDYELLLAEQNGVCNICAKAETAMQKGAVQRLAVDHCHESGEIRGLLCAGCNVALGLMKDDPTRLRKAAAYIENANKSRKVA